MIIFLFHFFSRKIIDQVCFRLILMRLPWGPKPGSDRVFLKDGNSISSVSIINGVTAKYQWNNEQNAEIDDYRGVSSILNGQPIYALDKSVLTSLENYLGNSGFAKAWAENILTLYGAHFPPTSVLDGEVSPRSAKWEKRQTDRRVSIRPNPATDKAEFVFSFPASTAEISLRMVDINGVTIKFKDGLLSSDTFVWETAGCAAGIYFYQVISSGICIESGKIIVNK